MSNSFFSLRNLLVRLASLTVLLLLVCGIGAPSAQAQQTNPLTYLRFELEGQAVWGLLRDETVSELKNAPYHGTELTGRTFRLEELRLLAPAVPSKVFAVGMNFASHISSRADAPPPLFLKLPSAIIGHQTPIYLPEDAGNVHFEGELVLVIGKKASRVTQAVAMEHVFGVTAGNDLTERTWQSQDLQWMRAKASDGFGPTGPYLVQGLDPNKLLLTTRLNGQIVQQENTENMIHKPAKVVSYLSQYFTLEPGDLIFMGTPGRTSALKEGDEIAVTLEGVGTVSNRVTWKDK
ncbi:fumarylacetoacetate hydrolase family protein [Rhodovibrionaceae bacterium A322]